MIIGLGSTSRSTKQPQRFFERPVAPDIGCCTQMLFVFGSVQIGLLNPFRSTWIAQVCLCTCSIKSPCLLERRRYSKTTWINSPFYAPPTVHVSFVETTHSLICASSFDSPVPAAVHKCHVERFTTRLSTNRHTGGLVVSGTIQLLILSTYYDSLQR